MSENASHIIIHHYIDSSNFNSAGVMCYAILIAIVVVLLVTLMGLLIYVVMHSKKCRKASRVKRSKRRPARHAFDNVVDETSSCGAVDSRASTAMDLDEEGNPNVQSIPLTSLGRKAAGRRGDSSESSAGLYDVLFPEKHGGEVLYDPPTKLVTFAGQVYVSNGQNSRARSETGPSGSGLNGEADSGSLEWDYFDHGNPADAGSSEVELEVDPQEICDVCWV